MQSCDAWNSCNNLSLDGEDGQGRPTAWTEYPNVEQCCEVLGIPPRILCSTYNFWVEVSSVGVQRILTWGVVYLFNQHADECKDDIV